MGVRLPLLASAALLLGIATPAMAQDLPDGLGCMAASYDAEQQATIDELIASYDASDETDSAKGDQLGEFASNAALACFMAHDWTEDQVFQAVLFEVGRLNEAAFRRSGPLPGDSLAKIDAALAEEDRTELWGLLERGVVAGMEGVDPGFTTRENFIMGMFILGSGMPDAEENAVSAGMILGFMAMQRMSAREFAKAGAKAER